MRIVKSFILLHSILFIPFTSVAETDLDEDSAFSPTLVITASGGVAIATNLGESQTFPIGYSQYDYQNNTNSDATTIWGAFVGTQLPIQSEWDAQIGLAYYQAASFPVNGVLQQGVDPSTSTPFNYDYELMTRQLLVEGKLLYEWHERFYPYISAGLGIAINDAKDYQIDYPANLIFTPFFDNQTSTSFTYMVGIGIDYEITQYLRAGLGYRFSDLGKADLGQGYSDPINPIPIDNTFEQSHIYAHEALVQLTYIR